MKHVVFMENASPEKLLINYANDAYQKAQAFFCLLNQSPLFLGGKAIPELQIG